MGRAFESSLAKSQCLTIFPQPLARRRRYPPNSNREWRRFRNMQSRRVTNRTRISSNHLSLSRRKTRRFLLKRREREWEEAREKEREERLKKEKSDKKKREKEERKRQEKEERERLEREKENIRL